MVADESSDRWWCSRCSSARPRSAGCAALPAPLPEGATRLALRTKPPTWRLPFVPHVCPLAGLLPVRLVRDGPSLAFDLVDDGRRVPIVFPYGCAGRLVSGSAELVTPEGACSLRKATCCRGSVAVRPTTAISWSVSPAPTSTPESWAARSGEFRPSGGRSPGEDSSVSFAVSPGIRMAGGIGGLSSSGSRGHQPRPPRAHPGGHGARCRTAGWSRHPRDAGHGATP